MNQKEINLKFYENLVEIAKNVFGDLPESEIKYTEEGRGSSPDDMLYIISEYYKNKQWDIWNLKNSVYMAEAVRLAVNLYCEENNITKYKDMITMQIEKFNFKMSYKDPETNVIYSDIRPSCFIDVFSTFDKYHINVEFIIPEFILNEPVSIICNNPKMQLEEVIYRNKRIETIFKKCSEQESELKKKPTSNEIIDALRQLKDSNDNQIFSEQFLKDKFGIEECSE